MPVGRIPEDDDAWIDSSEVELTRSTRQTERQALGDYAEVWSKDRFL